MSDSNRHNVTLNISNKSSKLPFLLHSALFLLEIPVSDSGFVHGNTLGTADLFRRCCSGRVPKNKVLTFIYFVKSLKHCNVFCKC